MFSLQNQKKIVPLPTIQCPFYLSQKSPRHLNTKLYCRRVRQSKELKLIQWIKWPGTQLNRVWILFDNLANGAGNQLGICRQKAPSDLFSIFFFVIFFLLPQFYRGVCKGFSTVQFNFKYLHVGPLPRLSITHKTCIIISISRIYLQQIFL